MIVETKRKTNKLRRLIKSSRLQIFFKIDVLKNWQYAQKNTCVGSAFSKL